MIMCDMFPRRRNLRMFMVRLMLGLVPLRMCQQKSTAQRSFGSVEHVIEQSNLFVIMRSEFVYFSPAFCNVVTYFSKSIEDFQIFELKNISILLQFVFIGIFSSTESVKFISFY